MKWTKGMRYIISSARVSTVAHNLAAENGLIIGPSLRPIWELQHLVRASSPVPISSLQSAIGME